MQMTTRTKENNYIQRQNNADWHWEIKYNYKEKELHTVIG